MRIRTSNIPRYFHYIASFKVKSDTLQKLRMQIDRQQTNTICLDPEPPIRWIQKKTRRSVCNVSLFFHTKNFCCNSKDDDYNCKLKNMKERSKTCRYTTVSIEWFDFMFAH